jgi:hypothetical protein
MGALQPRAYFRPIQRSFDRREHRSGDTGGAADGLTQRIGHDLSIVVTKGAPSMDRRHQQIRRATG